MDVVALEDSAGESGRVGIDGAQALESSLLVAERGEESIGELGGVKKLGGEFRNSFFDFYGVYGCSLAKFLIVGEEYGKIPMVRDTRGI